MVKSFIVGLGALAILAAVFFGLMQLAIAFPNLVIGGMTVLLLVVGSVVIGDAILL